MRKACHTCATSHQAATHIANNLPSDIAGGDWGAGGRLGEAGGHAPFILGMRLASQRGALSQLSRRSVTLLKRLLTSVPRCARALHAAGGARPGQRMRWERSSCAGQAFKTFLMSTPPKPYKGIAIRRAFEPGGGPGPAPCALSFPRSAGAMRQNGARLTRSGRGGSLHGCEGRGAPGAPPAPVPWRRWVGRK